MPDRTRPIRKEICLNEQELNLIQHKMRQLGTHNFGAYARKLTNFAELFSNGFAGLHRFVELMGTEPAITDAPDAAAMPAVRGARRPPKRACFWAPSFTA